MISKLNIWKFWILNIVLIVAITKIQAQNLVLNPGFESGNSGWVPFTTSSANTFQNIVNTNPNSGVSCLKISINSTETVTAGALQTFPTTPLQHYLLEYSVRTDSVNGSVLAYLNFGDTAVYYENAIMQTNGTTNWQRFQSRFTIPEGNNTNLIVFLFFSGRSGSAYFDDVSLKLLSDTSYSVFSVNLTENLGMIKNFMGTNVGPVRTNSPVNLTENFQQTGLNYVRTHDYYGACDISTIFPDTSRNASDSTAYNFASSDFVIAASINAGCKILFRLGESYEANPIHNNPPADMNKWADVCLNIVKHYNHGWNNGFNYNIKEWEVWNEPDGYAFWSGSSDDFVNLYRHTSLKLKQFDSTLLIGGPGIASVFSTEFLNTFFTAISTENLPFDFFSYHYYNIANPYFYSYLDSLVTKKLLQFGLSSAKRYVTEWSTLNFSGNINQIEVWHNNPYVSAQAASVLSYWQNNGPDKAFWYRTDEYLFGLFNESNGTYTYSGRTFQALNFLNKTQYRLATTGNDFLGKTFIAGQTALGDSLNFLISDHSSSAKGYTINVNNIDPNYFYTYQIYRVLTSDSMTSVSSGVVLSNNSVISINGITPFTDLIKLEKHIMNKVDEFSMNNNAFFAYPNPAKDQLNITLVNTENIPQIIQMFNSQGKLVQTLHVIRTMQIDISNLPPGIYYLKSNADPSLVQKIIKI